VAPGFLLIVSSNPDLAGGSLRRGFLTWRLFRSEEKDRFLAGRGGPIWALCSDRRKELGAFCVIKILFYDPLGSNSEERISGFGGGYYFSKKFGDRLYISSETKGQEKGNTVGAARSVKRKDGGVL